MLKEEGFDFKSLTNGIDTPFTITVEDALTYFESDKQYFDSNLANEVREIKALRNNIEHHRFTMDTKEVRFSLGRLIREVEEFTGMFNIVNLKKVIDKEHLSLFKTLSDEYEHEFRETLREAKIEAKESHKKAFNVKPKYHNLVEWTCYDCPECGEDGNDLMIPNDLSSTKFKCTMCGNEESYLIEVECDICSTFFPNYDMSTQWENYDNVCPNCNDFENKT